MCVGGGGGGTETLTTTTMIINFYAQRERERDRQGDRQSDRQTDRDRGSRQRKRKGERDTQRREIFHTWVQVHAGLKTNNNSITPSWHTTVAAGFHLAESNQYFSRRKSQKRDSSFPVQRSKMQRHTVCSIHVQTSEGNIQPAKTVL